VAERLVVSMKPGNAGGGKADEMATFKLAVDGDVERRTRDAGLVQGADGLSVMLRSFGSAR
jgi:hypothetical protein